MTGGDEEKGETDSKKGATGSAAPFLIVEQS
jgi:hypothetical protein